MKEALSSAHHTECSAARSLKDVFRECVQGHGDRPALVAHGKVMSYAALDRRSRSAGGALIDRFGVEDPDDPHPVVLLFDHEPKLFVSMLSVVLAGRMYAPFDPTFPKEQLARQAKDANPLAVLTTAKYSALAASISTSTTPVITLEELQNRAPMPYEALPSGDRLLGYLIYTSGTTGEPKGIFHSQKSLLRSVRHYWADLQVTARDRIGLVLPATYTPSVFSTFAALLRGAGLFPFDLRNRTLDELPRWLSEEQITLLYSSPTIFRRMMERGTPAAHLSSLRGIQVAGEPLYASDVKMYRERCPPSLMLYNGMGTTETSCLTRYFVPTASEGLDLDAVTIPIGRPYDDVDAEIIDEEGRVVKGRGEGELVVTSQFWAEGYWGRPELSAEKFTRPLGSSRGLRTYRTGDLVRRLKSGDLVHLGRRDRQVKLRGQRLELEGLEATLLEAEGVKEAVALLISSENQRDFLAAFVAPKLDTGTVRAHLSKNLPPHMMPTRLVSLESLPMSSSGKVDRRKLEGYAFSLDPQVRKEPSSALEETVLDLFREVLNNPGVELDSDFFESGGDSFIGVELAIAIEARLGAPINLSALIEAPTPRGIARIAEKALFSFRSRMLLQFPGPPGGYQDDAIPLFCIPGIGGTALTFRAIGNGLSDFIPVYAYDFPGRRKGEALVVSVAELSEMCFRELMRVRPEGPVAVLCFSVGGLVGLELARRLTEAGRRVAHLILLDCYAPEVIRARHIVDSVEQLLTRVRRLLVPRLRLSLSGKKEPKVDEAAEALKWGVFWYRPRPVSVDKTLLIVARNEPRHVAFRDNHSQWYRLMGDRIVTVKLDADHTSLIQPSFAPQILELVKSELHLSWTEDLSPGLGGLRRFSHVWSFRGAKMPLVRRIPRQQLPAIPRALLDNGGQLTESLSSMISDTPYPDLMTSIQVGRYYARKVVLRASGSGKPLALAAICLSMGALPADARRSLVEGGKPLGRILVEFGVDYRCELLGLMEIDDDPDLREALDITSEDFPLYGRYNRFLSSAKELLADVVEILHPDIASLVVARDLQSCAGL